jgi:glycosyltransferase involved in cell wall biosynthesis
VPPPSPPCSVVILTLNEERNLPECLASLAGFADVHLLDSGSTDATQAIARAAGAQVGVNRFRSFGEQRNWGHDHLALAHDWVLHLDADERMTPALRLEIDAVLRSDDGSLAGYYLAERTLLHGQWLRWAGQYPRYQARLVHRRRMRFVDHGHGQREQSALPFGTLAEPYDHLAFSHGMEAWLRKHTRYAMQEAEAALDPSLRPARLVTALLGGGPERRRALKHIASHAPLRPTLRWLYVMLVCRGFLDGRAGWQYAEMMKAFQHMIDLSMRELAHARRARPDAETQGRTP